MKSSKKEKKKKKKKFHPHPVTVGVDRERSRCRCVCGIEVFVVLCGFVSFVAVDIAVVGGAAVASGDAARVLAERSLVHLENLARALDALVHKRRRGKVLGHVRDKAHDPRAVLVEQPRKALPRAEHAPGERRAQLVGILDNCGLGGGGGGRRRICAAAPILCRRSII
jgi:hypothetical protein